MWQFWIESLLIINCWEDALTLIRAVLLRTNSSTKGNNFEFEGVKVLTHSNKMWSLLIDLEFNFGSEENIKIAFQKMIDLKTVTAKNVLVYADLLERNKNYSTLSQTFEIGLKLFDWPTNHMLWMDYLNKSIKVYGHTKIERVRDLFERVLRECPPSKRIFYYVKYSEYEEQFGLISHCVEILDRMVENIPEEIQIKGYELYICKVAELLGATKTRPLFEKALNNILDDSIIPLGLIYAEFERNLGEIDRARGIYYYISQFCDPSFDDNQFWKLWDQFELKCGNEDTYKEMMRVKRSVETVFEMLPASMKKIERQIELEEKKEEINKKIITE